MSESDGRRPSSFIDDEQIEIKPSTELIPDEYERKDNANILVEFVCRQTDEVAEDLAMQLSKLGFLVNKTFYTDKASSLQENWISSFVASVNDKTKQNNYDGLLMIFAKVPFRNEVLKTVWGNFTSTKCPALKNKPKIFILQISKRGLLTDSTHIPVQTDLKMAYDTPSEADILIVYDKIALDSSNDFLENFHDHVFEYGHQEDIINLVSLSIGSESRPLVISTMTRKFFFTLNQYRGHHHNINENHVEIKESLEKIMTFIKTIPDQKPRDKEKSLSFRQTIKNTFSFRTKNEHGKKSDSGNKPSESDKGQKINEAKETKISLVTSKLGDVKEEKPVLERVEKKPKKLQPVEPVMLPPTKSPTRKSSLSVPITPTRKNSVRSRNLSGSFSSKEDLAKKPPWK